MNPTQSSVRCTSFTGRHNWGRWVGDRWHSACWVTGTSLGHVTCKRCGINYLTAKAVGPQKTFEDLVDEANR